MRSFQTKLVLPLVLLVVLIGAFMEFYWLPNWQQQEVETRLAENQSSLELLGKVLRTPIIAGDLAAVHDLLDQLTVERAHWQSLTLTRADGLLLYPLTLPNEKIDVSHVLKADVRFQDEVLAQLSLSINLSAYLEVERDRLRMLELILLAIALGSVLLVAWLQRQLVLKPIERISGTARQIAKGDFYSPIPDHPPRSGLSDFFHAFRVMRDSIAEKHEELSLQITERENAERRLNDSQRVALLGCWEWHAGENRFWCSESMYPIMHFQERTQADYNGFFANIHPADVGSVKASFDHIAEEGGSFDVEFRVNTASGLKFVHMIGQYDPKSGRSFGTCQDVTERKDIESSLRKLSSAITYSGSSVMITDIIGTIEYVNPKYTEATGYQLSELLGQQPEILSRQWMSSNKYEVLWQSILAGKNWRGELQSLRRDGTMFWSLVSISPIKNEFGELTHFVIVLEDVSELKQAHAKMEKLALYDELTGLANRRLFYSKLGQLLDKMDEPVQKAKGNTGAVMLLDLDYFKTINDTRGHHVGDELLKAVARRLRHALHEEDVAARLGGDEFALLISPVESEEQVLSIAERILMAVSRPFNLDDAELQVTTSLGIALVPKDGTEPDSLLKHADLAMYQAKEMGRNQCRFFTESLHEQLQTYMRFTREMPIALDNGEFLLNYQPQVDLKTGEIIGAEALIRWQHPELGVVPPPAFISVAEETGFIIPLGRWVVAAACKALRELKAAGQGQMRISVNLSARQFRDPDLIGMISQVLADEGVSPELLEIEITETLLMHDVKQAIATLEQLQALGITVAIDDFGIGYSSFSYLKTLPINVLKVDRDFIKDIPDHLDDMEITAAIISMAHRLNLQVVAEGIETEVQRVFLEEHHCDYGQGYLFSRPLPLEQFKALLPASVESVTNTGK